MATPWGLIFEAGSAIIDELWETDEEKANAKAKLMALKQQGKLKALEVRMSAINNEAQSEHKMVALARPSFMYIFYAITLMLVVVFPVIGIFSPEAMAQLYLNVEKGFTAIPEAMWNTFLIGYLGYTGAREYGKHSKRSNDAEH
jgi:hypothetical protein